eukprot:734536-Prymnesium_polylepis.1
MGAGEIRSEDTPRPTIRHGVISSSRVGRWPASIRCRTPAGRPDHVQVEVRRAPHVSAYDSVSANVRGRRRGRRSGRRRLHSRHLRRL